MQESEVDLVPPWECWCRARKGHGRAATVYLGADRDTVFERGEAGGTLPVARAGVTAPGPAAYIVTNCPFGAGCSKELRLPSGFTAVTAPRLFAMLSVNTRRNVENVEHYWIAQRVLEYHPHLGLFPRLDAERDPNGQYSR